MAMPQGNVRLNKASDVRRMLSRVINELLQMEPTLDRARVLATLSNSLIKAIESTGTDEKLVEIEQWMQESKSS